MCCDGVMHLNRMMVGLIFSSLKSCPAFEYDVDIIINLPERSRKEVRDLVNNVVSVSQLVEDFLDLDTNINSFHEEINVFNEGEKDLEIKRILH